MCRKILGTVPRRQLSKNALLSTCMPMSSLYKWTKNIWSENYNLFLTFLLRWRISKFFDQWQNVFYCIWIMLRLLIKEITRSLLIFSCLSGQTINIRPMWLMHLSLIKIENIDVCLQLPNLLMSRYVIIGLCLSAVVCLLHSSLTEIYTITVVKCHCWWYTLIYIII